MIERVNPTLTLLSSGVPGLDEVLCGGIPEYSFNMIAGEPGSGKTTLAQQILFARATEQHPAIYFTVLGEPPIKMLRYLQRMSFCDLTKIGSAIRFVDLSALVLEHDLDKVLDRIIAEMRTVEPALLVVDSFRAVLRSRFAGQASELALQSFLQRLALHLTSWEATTFLVGEYLESELQDNPVFTIADGIFWLSQNRERSSVVRRLQVLKLRGQASMPGMHTFRIGGDGLRVFPRMVQRAPAHRPHDPRERFSSGVPGLDAVLGGGIPVGDTMLVAGPSGAGKTCLCMQFIAASPPEDRAVLVVFEEHPEDYLQRATGMGLDLEQRVRDGMITLISLRPLDLSVDETLEEIRDAVERTHARRLVIDSLTGFEVALASAFRLDFRESLYRMLGALTGAGVTILMTVEVTESWDELRFSPHGVSFLTENIVILRYAEIDGTLKKLLAVIKMRRSGHSSTLHELEITSRGMVIKGPLTQYQGILTGEPKLREAALPLAYPGLTEPEGVVLDLLLGRRELGEEAIAAATGLDRAVVARSLRRLVELDYAFEVDTDGRTAFRPLARPLGQ